MKQSSLFVFLPLGAALLAAGSGPTCVLAWEVQAPSSALMGWWRFDEGAGNSAKDSSGSSVDCAAGPGSALVWSGKGAGRAPQFNGEDDYLQANDESPLNLTGALTIEFWIRPSEWAEHASQGIVSKKKSDGDRGYVIYNNGGSPSKMCIRVSGTEGGRDIFSTSDVDVGAWQHWAITYDPATKTAVWYKNGVPDSTTAPVSIGDMSTDAPFQIGHSQTWNGYFAGELQDVRVYRRSLAAEEILAAYHATSRAMAADSQAQAPIRWRVLTTRYPTDDVVIAGYTVQEFGARGDGSADDTAAFQSALFAMARQGGGTVFAPEARYVIRGNLIVPTGVTLRGERQKPAEGKPVRGTILMAFAGQGNPDGRPFLRLKPSSGIRDLVIWYPEQNAKNIKPYPFCLTQTGGDNATIEDVTLVNPYQGISIGPGNNELHFIKNVDGSPLSIGLVVDFLTDTGRHENIHFTPDMWSDSGLPGAPPRGGAHAKWMYENGTGMRFQRVDTECSAFDVIKGYKVGIETVASSQGLPYAHFYDVRVTDCATALSVVNAHFIGLTFTRCLFDGKQTGVSSSDTLTSTLLFHSCTIRGKEMAANLRGSTGSTVLFENCTFDGSVSRPGGALSLRGCQFKGPGSHLLLGDSVTAATIAGCSFEGASHLVNKSESDRILISSAPLILPKLPDVRHPGVPRIGPAKPKLYVVTDAPWNAKEGGATDDTLAIQAALDAAGKGGGGIVFLPGGEYAVRGHLTVPSGVELRGVYDVPHHSVGKGSLLCAYAGRGDEAAAPFVVLQSRSILRGVTFLYPEEKVDTIVPYPFTVQGRGSDISIIDTTAINAYNLIDLASYRCDRHTVDYAAGGAFHIGIALGGGSVDGEVCNVHFNPHYWGRSPYRGTPGQPEGWRPGQPLPTVDHVLAHFDAMHIGACKNELLWAIGVCPMHRGVILEDQNGDGATGVALGLILDSAKIPITVEGLGSAGMDFISTEIACYSPSPDRRFVVCREGFRSQARFFNTVFWGEPALSTTVNGGSLLFDLGHFSTYAPFQVDGGKLSLEGMSFDTKVKPDSDLSVREPGRVDLVGNLSSYGLSADSGSAPAAVSRTLENERNSPVSPGAREISVFLRRNQKSQGLALRQQDGESENAPALRSGKECWEGVKQLSGGMYYLYFLVEFPEFQNGRAPTATVTFQYFDEGDGDCRILYDSSDETVKGIPETPGAWKEAGRFKLTGTNSWKTFSFRVNDAMFERRCNGGDIRLDFQTGKVRPAVEFMTIRRSE